MLRAARRPNPEAAVAGALRSEDLRPPFVLPPTVFGASPTTGGSAFYLAGVPVVHFRTAPMHLLDPADTIDKIHVPSEAAYGMPRNAK
jgi:hypothetical protein